MPRTTEERIQELTYIRDFWRSEIKKAKQKVEYFDECIARISRAEAKIKKES